MEQNKHKGYGAILGDLVGSSYEFKNPIKSREFDFYSPENHFTDDTIMTIATMDAILHDIPYTIAYKYWGNKYSGDYYGKNFKEWLKKESFEANDSFGNGAAMRVSPIGYVHRVDSHTIIEQASKSIISSHNNEQAKTGGITIALLIAKLNRDRHHSFDKIKDSVNGTGYIEYGKLYPTELVQFEKFKVSCDYTVPVAIKVFTESKDMEDCIRTAVWLGGDCDTIGSMAAELRCAYDGGVTEEQARYVLSKLPEDMIKVLIDFNEKY